jgi:ABC-type glycerol-3-phosphate transport system substrate-binding protein
LASFAGCAGRWLPLRPQSSQGKEISFLTWNIADQELFKEWIAEFKKFRPDVDIEWLDKGPGTPPIIKLR